MMPLLWVMLWSVLPSVAYFSGPDHCRLHESSSSQSESPVLRSLQCYNDYKSFVHCKWSEPRNTALQLWFQTDNSREQCLPYGDPLQDTSDSRIVQCRYQSQAFAIGIKHSVFFLKETETHCSSVSQKPLHLSQHLRARTPVDLSTRDTDDGGQQLSWSSPYPSSSSLNKNIKYQLSYSKDRQDNWMTENVTKTSMKLEKQLLLPGHRYEARVRAQASVGHWSHWSPVVTWQTEEDTGQFPSLHCVLDREKEVRCSWEVSRELVHFITHQLVCRHNHSALSERCCENQTVTSDPAATLLRYSCSLTVEDPAHLLLELLPTRNAKTFKANQHIRPYPPQQLKVREKGNNWIVEWTHPSTASEVRLYYQLCYYRTQNEECSIQNIPVGSMSLNILQDSLVPSQSYQVKVRSLVVPEEDSIYGGIPSEWTDPVEWTSHNATWSFNTLIYLSVGVFVAIVFLTLYCTIPACQRRVILWVDSVPSPGKSKILSEIKSATSWTLVQSENTSMCKVQHLHSISTCSSVVLMWPDKDSEKKESLGQDEDCWKCDNQPSLEEEVDSSGASSMSFSGPYIFCQESEPNSKSVDIRCEEEEEETPSDDSASPPLSFTIFGEGYVCLPNRKLSRSTQDLVSHSEANTNAHRHASGEQGRQRPDSTPLQPEKMDVEPEPDGSDNPPAYTSGPFTPWLQGGIVHASGYCHLPIPENS